MVVSPPGGNIGYSEEFLQHFEAQEVAHNALNDAIATAELLMAQVSNVTDQQNIKLKDLLL